MKTKKQGKSDEFKKNLFLFIAAVLVFFLIFEAVLRIFSYPVYGFQEGAFQKDSIIGYLPSSNYSGLQSLYQRVVKINTNSKGLRDFREYSYEKTKKKRILILGDSYAFGNGVELEESYPELLRKKLNNTEIINLGVPGYGINNEYLYYINEGMKYDPDIVIVHFSINDWGTDQIVESENGDCIDRNYSLVANEKGYLVSGNRNEGLIRSVHLFLLANLRSYSFIYSKSRLLFAPIIKRLQKTKEAPLMYSSKNSEAYKAAYQGYYNLLKKIKKAGKADIILFVGPHNADLISPETINREYGLNNSAGTAQLKESLREISDRLKIKFINIEIEDLENKDIFLKVDGHWTTTGHKLITEKLYSNLKEA
ncbi:hypothetical protein A3K73_05700 [Candidatus Pacearchaeota archaeon RBG_13_36_9]|nr:MAG: hypothetical protein A3K73_05700 [Candidatus Pacearchaeota archaeon RBG_13_36_9]